MKTIVVATDLSERSGLAMQRAVVIARQMKARLQVLHVVDDGLPARIADAILMNTITELEKQIAENSGFKGLDVQCHVEFGHPWEAIVLQSQEMRADLIVAGAHRNRGFRELFGGTTLHRIAKTSRIPLLVVTKETAGPYTKALVGVDFSNCAQNAANLASRMTPDHPLTLVHAYHIPFKAFTKKTDRYGDIVKHEQKRIDSEVHLEMKDFVKRLDNPTPHPAVVVKEGNAFSILEAEANARKADLICVGSHGKSWLAETILGSTAEDLLSHPPCDILVAPLA